MRFARRREQQRRRIRRAAGDDHDIGRDRLALAVALDHDAGHGGAGRVGLEPQRPRAGAQRHVGVFQRGPDGQHLGVGLRVHQAREAVARRAAHARAVRHVGLVEHHAARRVERPQARRREVVRELLDARLVADGRERIGTAGRRLGRILAARPVDAVELLGLQVVGLDLVVGDRPRGRDAVVVIELAEVLLAQPVQRRAVELRRAADEVVDLRLERLAVLVVPGVLGDVAVVDEDVGGRPVLRLARQPVAALDQQHPLAGRSQAVDEGAPAGAATDHDDVVVAHPLCSSMRSARMIRAAASISARCENACGKLPRCRPVSASSSSA